MTQRPKGKGLGPWGPFLAEASLYQFQVLLGLWLSVRGLGDIPLLSGLKDTLPLGVVRTLGALIFFYSGFKFFVVFLKKD